MENEIILVNGKQIEIAKETSKKIKKLITARLELQKIEDQIKEEMLSVMENSGITAWENDLMKISYKSAYTRKGVDTALLKADGLYDKYCKETPVKASISVSFK